jgi:hypothetical protein
MASRAPDPRIENLITALRESRSDAEYYYGSMNPYSLFRILKSIFIRAEPLFKDGHVITEIRGYHYDITGRISNDGYRRLNDG